LVEQLMLALDGVVRQWQPAARTYVDHLGGLLAAHLVRTHSTGRVVVPSVAGLTDRQFQAAIGTHYCGTALYKSCPSRERLLRCATVLGSAALREIATSDLYWDRIVSIESLGPQPVYDATVKGTHNFIADGLVSHNSIEQDSDVVILLHREDAYERESPRAGEADLIVAKHRNGPTATVTVAFQGHYSRFVDMAG